MKSGWVLVLLTPLLAALSGCVKSSNGTNPGTGFMWVATQGDQRVTAFTVNLSNGAVSQAGSAVATGVTPTAAAITPDGTSLFVANSGDNTVSSYTVKSDGSLTASGNPAGVGQFPVALAVDPSSKFLFVANQGTSGDVTSGTVSVFSVQGAALSPVQGSPFRTVPANDVIDTIGTGPSAVAVAPTGNFLYVANQFTNDISIFSYDNTGVLTLITTCGSAPNCSFPRIAAGANPSGLAFSRCAGVTTATTSCPTADGNNLFVANSGSNNISVFASCIQVSATCPAPDGTLAAVSGSPFAAGVSPVAFMIHPALNFVYAVDSKSNQVSQYKYSSATGALTTLSPAAASTGPDPLSGGITSDGNWAFVTNNGGSTLTAYGVTSGGKLNPAATASIPLSGQPSAIVVK